MENASLPKGVTYKQGTYRGARYHVVEVKREDAAVEPRPYLTSEERGEVLTAVDRKARTAVSMNGTFFGPQPIARNVLGEVKTPEQSFQPIMVKKRTYWSTTPDGSMEMQETVPSGTTPEGRTIYRIPRSEWDRFTWVLGGGGRLLHKGVPTSVGAGHNDQEFQDDVLARRNRSALGFSSDGKTFWLVSCDNPGWTPQTTAAFMKKLGASEAMFVDGGGSTEMVVTDRIVTRLSDGSERRLPTAVVLI